MEQEESKQTIKKRGRPFGVTGKYKDEKGVAIGVYQWRKLFRSQHKEQDTSTLIKRMTENGFTRPEAESFIVKIFKNAIKSIIND